MDAKSSTFCWRFNNIFDCSVSFDSSSETSGLKRVVIKQTECYGNILEKVLIHVKEKQFLQNLKWHPSIYIPTMFIFIENKVIKHQFRVYNHSLQCQYFVVGIFLHTELRHLTCTIKYANSIQRYVLMW